MFLFCRSSRAGSPADIKKAWFENRAFAKGVDGTGVPSLLSFQNLAFFLYPPFSSFFLCFFLVLFRCLPIFSVFLCLLHLFVYFFRFFLFLSFFPCFISLFCICKLIFQVSTFRFFFLSIFFGFCRCLLSSFFLRFSAFFRFVFSSDVPVFFRLTK